MNNKTMDVLQDYVVTVHERLLRAGSTTQDEHFTRVWSPDAPPIGWHIWHIARFADRLQSKLAAITQGSPSEQMWYRGCLAQQWAILPTHLGALETGMGQAQVDAVHLVIQASKAGIMEYAQSVFATCDATVQQLTSADLERVYFGFLDYDTDPETGEVWATEATESLVAQDLIVHAGHSARHLGMIEALRGLLGAAGSVTV